MLCCSYKYQPGAWHHYPLVHVADMNCALSFNGQGTYLASQARAAQVLLSNRASYSGFVDRRTRAVDVQAPVAPSSSTPMQIRSSRSRTPSFVEEPLVSVEEASTSSSRGYTLVPPPEQEISQPINLTSLLTLPGHGRGRDTSCGRGSSQGRGTFHGLRASVQANVPLSFSPEEVAASHRDKCPRLDSISVKKSPNSGFNCFIFCMGSSTCSRRLPCEHQG